MAHNTLLTGQDPLEQIKKARDRDRHLIKKDSKDDEMIIASMDKDLKSYEKKWLDALHTDIYPTVIEGMQKVAADRRAPPVVRLKALIILTMGDLAPDGASSREKWEFQRNRVIWNEEAINDVDLCKSIYKSSKDQQTLDRWNGWLMIEEEARADESLDTSDDEPPFDDELG